MYNNAGLQIKAISCSVDYDQVKKIAAITPVLLMVCTKRQLLVASVHIDDHELRSSLTVVVDEGEREYQIPHVKIANPALEEYTYKLTIKLHLDNEQVHELDHDLQIKQT